MLATAVGPCLGQRSIRHRSKKPKNRTPPSHTTHRCSPCCGRHDCRQPTQQGGAHTPLNQAVVSTPLLNQSLARTRTPPRDLVTAQWLTSTAAGGCHTQHTFRPVPATHTPSPPSLIHDQKRRKRHSTTYPPTLTRRNPHAPRTSQL